MPPCPTGDIHVACHDSECCVIGVCCVNLTLDPHQSQLHRIKPVTHQS
ncbi:hypothetical protein [Acinetobacter baumannii]